jgi:hypothetical protein
MLSPFAMYVAFPRSDYYEDSVPYPNHWLSTSLPAATPAGRRGGRSGMVPTFTHRPIDG